MNETMKAKTARGADFELEVREQKNSPELEVVVRALGKEGYLRSLHIVSTHGVRGLATSIEVNGQSLHLSIAPQDEEKIESFLSAVRMANEERRARWVELSVGPCRDSDYRTHKINFWIDEPIEDVVGRAINELTGCCWEKEAAEEWDRKRVEAFFREREEAENKKQAKENHEKEVRELAVRTGERQLLEVYFTECDGSVRECSADLIRVYIRPDGEKVKERIHTY